jgi:hypothetical protein
MSETGTKAKNTGSLAALANNSSEKILNFKLLIDVLLNRLKKVKEAVADLPPRRQVDCPEKYS